MLAIGFADIFESDKKIIATVQSQLVQNFDIMVTKGIAKGDPRSPSPTNLTLQRTNNERVSDL